MYPTNFEKIIELFEKLPGVGNKTAQRYAFNMLKATSEEIDEYANIIKGLKEVRRCKTCGFLTDELECAYCKDESRDNSTIMVVEGSQDLVAVDRTGMYRGLYHVLGKLISSSKGIFPEDLDLDKFIRRITPEVKEIILALSPTLDGEMTSLYIEKLLKDYDIKISRLANGLPMGASLDYADELTLIKAMSNRVEVKK